MSTHYATVKLLPQDAPKRVIYLYWPRHGYYEVHSSCGRESYTWLGADDEVEILSKEEGVCMVSYLDDRKIDEHAKICKCPMCLANDNKRLLAGLRRLIAQDYDSGYSPEEYAQAVLDGHEPAHDR